MTSLSVLTKASLQKDPKKIRGGNFTPVTDTPECTPPIKKSGSSFPPKSNTPLSALIAEQFRSYKASNICQVKDCVQPRALFVSLVNLWRDWLRIPFDILFQSIIILPCKRTWFYDLKVCLTEIEKSSKRYRRYKKVVEFLETRSTHNQFKGFQAMILQKEKQGLLLFIDPIATIDSVKSEYPSLSDTIDDSSEIHPMWHVISQFIRSVSDPARARKYYPLQFDQDWWVAKFKVYQKMVINPQKYKESSEDLFTQFEFCCHRRKIMAEMKSLSFRHKPILEIFHQSNPTMIPMWRWSDAVWTIKVSHIVQFQQSLVAMGSNKNWDPISREQQSPNSDGYASDSEMIVLRYDHSQEFVSHDTVKSIRARALINDKRTDFVYCYE